MEIRLPSKLLIDITTGFCSIILEQNFIVSKASVLPNGRENPAKDHLPRPKLCGQLPIICLSAISEQPQREMETRLDYRERSRRVTSWSHNSSLLGLGLSLSVLWPGCSGLLPNLFSSSLSFASLLYSRSLPCSFTSTSYMYSTNRTYDRSVPFKGFLSHDLRVHQTSM